MPSVKPCPSCGEENADRARFCQNCATPLAAEGAAAAEVRKVVTVVFADVTGSTALGERVDPEALRSVMGRYFDEMSAVIERHGGTVEKFIGDAVMAVFGVPRLHEDDPLRAVRAAAGMKEALAALNEELQRAHGVGLQARIGVNTGEVVAGDPTGGQRLVTGDAVNVAARLEQNAPPGEVLLGEATWRLVKDAVEVEPVDPLELKGKAERVRAFQLLEVIADVAGHARHLDSPMVGRSKELEMLARALDRAATERTSHLFTLLGPAGVGKTRLVQEFLEGPASSVGVLQGRCLSYGEGITFYPLAEIVQSAAGVVEADDLATARAKLAALVAGADDEERIVALVAGLLSWGDEPAPAEEAFWGVRKLLEHLARDRPLVVVVDDLHWAEPTFLDLLEHLADWTRDAALPIVCVARPELLEVRPGWAGGKLNATTILLEPLPAGDASELVDNLLGRADIPATARERILEAAEGNPLFVEEMLGMLIDDGLLRFEDGWWRADDDLANVTVPPTISLLIAARLDRLDAEERAVIERGSVEGKVFHTGAVATLSPEALRPSVRPRLLALARKELIRADRAEFAGEDAFRFRSLLIRDAAYQAMPKEQRAELHERFAQWLERAAGERLPEYEEILGHHLEQAYRYRVELGPPDDHARALAEAAAARLMRSAERASDRGDPSAATQLYRTCAEICEGAARARALTELAEELAHGNDFAGALEAAGDAIAEATRAGDEPQALRAEVVRIHSRGQVDPTCTLAWQVAELERVRERLEELGDVEGIVRALIVTAVFAFWEGRSAECLRISRQVLDRMPSVRFRDREAVAMGFYVYGYFGPAPVSEMLEHIEQGERLLGGSLLGEALVGAFRVGAYGMMGRADEARAEADRVLGIWHEVGDPTTELENMQVLAETERLLGDPVRAERYLLRAVEGFDALGETGYNSTVTALLALALCDQGRFDEADAWVARSRELGATDDFATQAAWRMARSRILSHRGGHEEAIALADEAVAILEPSDYLAWRAEGEEVRGIALASAGRVDEARVAFGAALELFERKGVVLAIARLRERLAALG